MKSGIVIPCYNEENRLDTQAFLNFANFNRDFVLCFVNDGSKDKTLDVLKSMSEQAANIYYVDQPQNQGKAEAVRAGMKFIYDNTDAADIGFMDADLSTGFADYLNLVRVMDGTDQLKMVYGSRGAGAGEVERTALRDLFSKFVKLFIQMILKMPINDTQCGAKVFHRSLVPIIFELSFLTSWLFDVEMFIRVKGFYGTHQVMNYIYEQPLKKWVHMEDSKLTLKDSVKIPLMLANIWMSYNVLNSFPVVDQLSYTTTVANLNAAKTAVKVAA